MFWRFYRIYSDPIGTPIEIRGTPDLGIWTPGSMVWDPQKGPILDPIIPSFGGYWVGIQRARCLARAHRVQGAIQAHMGYPGAATLARIAPQEVPARDPPRDDPKRTPFGTPNRSFQGYPRGLTPWIHGSWVGRPPEMVRSHDPGSPTHGSWDGPIPETSGLGGTPDPRS